MKKPCLLELFWLSLVSEILPVFLLFETSAISEILDFSAISVNLNCVPDLDRHLEIEMCLLGYPRNLQDFRLNLFSNA